MNNKQNKNEAQDKPIDDPIIEPVDNKQLVEVQVRFSIQQRETEAV